MSRSNLITGVFILAIAALTLGSVHAQESKQKSDKKMPSQEEMMKKWQEFMTPGEPHKKLGAMVGTWDAEVKSWMNGPNGEPTVSKGTAEFTSTLGGRYVQESFTSEMMNQPFTGMGYTGYDNFKKKYVGFWIDNMTTAMMSTEGTTDKSGNTMTMWGKMDDPTSGQKDKKLKTVSHIVDPDKMVFDMYDVTTYGDKKPVMEITYTRKK